MDVWQGAREDATLAGIVALRGTDENTPLGTRMPAGVTRVKMWGLLHKYRFKGDTSLIHRTAIVQQHPYEVAPGEKFVAESMAFFAIDDDYDMLTYDHVLTICHYLPDGYTQNFVENTKKNPHWLHAPQARQCEKGDKPLRRLLRDHALPGWIHACPSQGRRARGTQRAACRALLPARRARVCHRLPIDRS